MSADATPFMNSHNMKQIMTDQLVSDLQHLMTIEDPRSAASIGCSIDIFYDLYEIGIAKQDFTEEEKRTIGNLFASVMPKLEVCIDREIFQFPTSSFKAACIIRSGLQYLVENYTDFPTGDNTFTTTTLRNSKHWLTDKIDWDEYRKCFENFRADPFGVDCYSDSDDEEEVECRERTHYWWFPSMRHDDDGASEIMTSNDSSSRDNGNQNNAEV